MFKPHVGVHALAVIGVEKSVRSDEVNLRLRSEDGGDDAGGLLVGEDLGVEPFWTHFVSQCIDKTIFHCQANLGERLTLLQRRDL